jgi:hypothetical protein
LLLIFWIGHGGFFTNLLLLFYFKEEAVALAGRLLEYSLAEVFRFIEEGRKTGLLSIDRGNGLLSSSKHQSYIWFQTGAVVAHASSLNGQELIDLATRSCHLNETISDTLRQQSAYMFKPLGKHLESQGLINSQQLRMLFSEQVLQPIAALFCAGDAAFAFDDTSLPVSSEMTGMSISATEISLQGLRVLRNWEFLQAKLPEPEYGIQRVRAALPAYPLEPEETALWNIADGQRTIIQIARKNNWSLLQTQQLAFRLVAVGLLKEVTLDCSLPAIADSTRVLPANHPQPAAPKSTVSQKFLSNLVGFLKKQG